MDSKVRDAEDDLKEKETRKNRLKRKLEKINGKNSKSTRNILKTLRREVINVL